MKGVYLSRHEPKQKYPIFASVPHYYATRYFLKALEFLVPEAIEELYLVTKYYTESVLNVIRNLPYNSKGGRLTEWEAIKSSEDDECRLFRNELLAWVQKYHLTNETATDTLYIEITIWSLWQYMYDMSEQEETKRDARRRQFVEVRGHSEDEYQQYFSEDFSKPKISLLDAVYIDEEIELGDIYDTAFPFVFTPKHASSNEELRNRLDDVLYTLRMDDSDPDKQPFLETFTEPWSGWGWNPQLEKWSDFEKKMDLLYKQYKKFYKNRTERFLNSKGYVVAKEKRNLYHFLWLVRYQVQGWSIRKIANHYADETGKVITEEAVRDALHSTAEFSSIHLRTNTAHREG